MPDLVSLTRARPPSSSSAEPWISPRPEGSYPWYVRLLFRAQKRKFGEVLLPTLFWGRLPGPFILFTLFFRYFERKTSKLDPALRALVMVRVSQINWCSFCVDLNSLFLIERSGSRAKLDAIEKWKESSIFSEPERAALAYAEEMTFSQAKVEGKAREELKRHFDDQTIIELTALIAYQNMSSKFNAALGIPSQGLCQLRKEG